MEKVYIVLKTEGDWYSSPKIVDVFETNRMALDFISGQKCKHNVTYDIEEYTIKKENQLVS